MSSQKYASLICALSVSCMLLSSLLWAQDDLRNLPDPTRPDLVFKGLNGEKERGLISDLMGSIGEESTQALPPKLLLQYTLIAPKRRLAVINGEMVEEGITIADAKIIKIRSEQVIARRFGERIILDLARYQVTSEESEQAVGEDDVISK